MIRRVMALCIQGEFRAIARNQHSLLGDALQVKLETPNPAPPKISARTSANAPKPRKRTAT